MKIVFFSNLAKHNNWQEMFEKVGFYRDDIQILKDLGHEVNLVSDFKKIRLDADLYFCWWWGYSFFPLLIGLLRGVPTIVTGAFDYSSGYKKIKGLNFLERPAYQKFMMKFVLRFSSANIFISKCEYKEVTNNLLVNKPSVAYLSVDSSKYFPQQFAGPRNTFFTVCWSDTTNAQRKGLYASYEAFKVVLKIFPHVQFIIAGKVGDAAYEIMKNAQKDGVNSNVNFVGLISDEQKIEYMRTCIAYMQPSIYEGFGLALAEAIATGAKVIVTNSGAIPEVAGQFGMYVDLDRSQTIIEAMLSCIKHPITYDEAVIQNQWIAKKFSYDNRRMLISNVIKEVCDA